MAEIQTFGGGKSKPTDETLNVNIRGERLEDPEPTPPETQTVEEQDRISQILERWRLMDNGRPDTEWQLFLDQFESNYAPRADGLSDAKLPVCSTTIKNKMADELSSIPLISFIPTGKDDIDKIDITQATWNHVWKEAKTVKETIKWVLAKNLYGTGIWFEGLHTEDSIIYDPTGVDNDGNVTFTKKKRSTSTLAGRNVDPRNFWIDPVDDIDKAEDCIEQDFITMAKLEELAMNPAYKNIDKVIATMANPEDEMPGLTTDEQQRAGASKNLVRRWRYWNKPLDQFIIIMNTNVEVFNSHNPYGHKQLPYTVVPDDLVLNTMYGRGVAKKVQNTTAELQSTRNILIDGMKMSSTTNLLVGQDIAIPSVEAVFGGNMWSVDGDANQIKELNIRDKSSVALNINTILMDDLTIWTGVDNRSLVGSPTKTAFEARLQEQTKLKGVAVNMMNVDIAMERWSNQRLSNIKQFFTRTYVDKLMGTNEVSNQTSKIVPLENKKVKKTELKNKKTKISLQNKPGFDMLELTGDELRSGLMVKVQTRTTTPILESIKNESMNTVLTQMAQLAQIKQLGIETNDETLSKIDSKKWVDQIITDNNLAPENLFETEGTTNAELLDSVMKEVALPPKS